MSSCSVWRPSVPDTLHNSSYLATPDKVQALTFTVGLYLIPNELSCKGVSFRLYVKCHIFTICSAALQAIALDVSFTAKHFQSNLPPRRRICLLLECVVMLQEFICLFFYLFIGFSSIYFADRVKRF